MDDIIAHKWEGNNISFLVQWNLGDTTWEQYAECKELAALYRYLELLGIDNGRLSTTAGDIRDAHPYMLPIDLLFCKRLFRAMLRLCSLPMGHPLYPCIRAAARRKVKLHPSPLHHLINFTGLNPKDIESISPVRQSPGYNPVFKSVVPLSKEAALPLANLTNSTVPVQVYSDGSGYEGGIGAAALLYIND